MNPQHIIVSGANDAYIDYLTDMLASIQDRLHDFDLGILDLGLSDASQARIRAFKEDAQILDPGWRLELPDTATQPPHKKIYYAKPFLPDLFPNYAGYLWVDADVWLQDADALAHYLEGRRRRPRPRRHRLRMPSALRRHQRPPPLPDRLALRPRARRPAHGRPQGIPPHPRHVRRCGRPPVRADAGLQ